MPPCLIKDGGENRKVTDRGSSGAVVFPEVLLCSVGRPEPRGLIWSPDCFSIKPEDSPRGLPLSGPVETLIVVPTRVHPCSQAVTPSQGPSLNQTSFLSLQKPLCRPFHLLFLGTPGQREGDGASVQVGAVAFEERLDAVRTCCRLGALSHVLSLCFPLSWELGPWTRF